MGREEKLFVAFMASIAAGVAAFVVAAKAGSKAYVTFCNAVIESADFDS